MEVPTAIAKCGWGGPDSCALIRVFGGLVSARVFVWGGGGFGLGPMRRRRLMMRDLARSCRQAEIRATDGGFRRLLDRVGDLTVEKSYRSSDLVYRFWRIGMIHPPVLGPGFSSHESKSDWDSICWLGCLLRWCALWAADLFVSKSEIRLTRPLKLGWGGYWTGWGWNWRAYAVRCSASLLVIKFLCC
jgi:hypothetical protein